MKEGKDGGQVHITSTSNLPVEAIEMEYPLRVGENSLVLDSGGAGRFRGGLRLRSTRRPSLSGHVEGYAHRASKRGGEEN